MNGSKLFLVGLLVALISSCSDDDGPKDLTDVSQQIEPDIFPYVQTFVDEAELRGLSFDFNGFEATFSDMDIDDNEDICGRASAFDDTRDFFTIRRSGQCWIDQTNATQEALVFHELGHALLDRPHRDDRFPNGLVRSIMETGMLGPYSDFSPLLRTYLFDEMFDERAEIPEWALNKTEVVLFDINSGLEESADGWSLLSTLSTSPIGIVSGARTNESAASGEFSLRITASRSVDETTFWRLRLEDVQGLPETADLNIQVRYRTQTVQGGGIAIAGSVDVDEDVVSFFSSEIDRQLTGTTNGFETIDIVVPYWPNRPANLSIILAVLPETTGVVFFDDITLNATYNPAFGPV